MMGQLASRLAALLDLGGEPIPRRRSHNKRQGRHESKSELEGPRRSRRHSRSTGRREKDPNDRRYDLRETDRSSRKAATEAPRAREQRRRPREDWRDEHPSHSRRLRRPGGNVDQMKPLPRTPWAEPKPLRRGERQHSSIPKMPTIHIEELRIEDDTLKRDCLVCVESRSLRHFPKRPPTKTCQHEVNTCKRCLRHWIKSEFAAKLWDQMNCPECGIRMEYDDMKEFAPSDVFQRYDKLNTKATLEAIPGFRWCIAKGCKSGQVHEGNLTPRFRCISCKASHCVFHQAKWHKGETCAQYDYRTDGSIKKAEEAASKKLIKNTAKICPGCTRPLEKMYGCDHITCLGCSHEFCWVCLAPYSRIRDQGNHMHRKTCLHWSPNPRNRTGPI